MTSCDGLRASHWENDAVIEDRPASQSEEAKMFAHSKVWRRTMAKVWRRAMAAALCLHLRPTGMATNGVIWQAPDNRAEEPLT